VDQDPDELSDTAVTVPACDLESQSERSLPLRLRPGEAANGVPPDSVGQSRVTRLAQRVSFPAAGIGAGRVGGTRYAVLASYDSAIVTLYDPGVGFSRKEIQR